MRPRQDLDDALESAGTPRKNISDATANTTYGFGYGFLKEYLWDGLSAGAVVGTRLTMIVPNIILGPPYGRYRDWLLNKTGLEDAPKLRRVHVESFATVSFFAPLYAGIVYGMTRDAQQTKEALESFALTSPIVGITMGLWFDKVRSWFGVERQKTTTLINETLEGTRAEGGNPT